MKKEMTFHVDKHRNPAFVRALYLLFIAWVLVVVMASGVFAASEERMGRDMDKDGRIDQVRVLGPKGLLLRVESDSDKDGHLDLFQYYENDQLVRVERDLDENGRPEVIDYFENGKRCRQERKNERGEIIVLATFDANEAPKVLKKDSREQGIFDQVYTFERGILKTLEQDSNGDGTMNVKISYTNNQPILKTVDDNGKPETEVTYNEKGQPEKSRHDMDRDGRMETTRYFENRDIVRQEKDQDLNGKPESVTLYTKGIPREESKDRNADGIMDCVLIFDDKGQVRESREDSLTKRKLERVRMFRNGKPLKTTWDADGDGFIESACFYENGRLVTQTKDDNKDGRPDTWIYFSAKEEKLRLESDTRFKGIVDHKLYFKNGDKHRALKDTDGDGYFETVQEFNGSAWDLVIRTDLNKTKNHETAYFYKSGVLLRMDCDENEDGKPDFREYYTRQGKIEKCEEFDPKTGKRITVWHYDKHENPVRATQDTNGEGRMDTVFYYRKGHLISVTEDTNKDGKPDIWETYDEAEILVSVKKDLDYDGVPDVVKSKEGTRRLLAEGKSEDDKTDRKGTRND